MTSPLFQNLTPEEIQCFLKVCSFGEINLKKDDFLVKSGDKVECFYFVKNGNLDIVRDDFWGNRTVISEVKDGGVFGAAYLFAEKSFYELSVVAKKDSVVLKLGGDFSPLDKELSTKMMKNTVKILASKDIALLTSNGHLSQRTTRKKILSYLNAVGGGNTVVTVPFNRQEMADYLAVDRSALSRELSLLQKDGVLSYNKNVFILKKQ